MKFTADMKILKAMLHLAGKQDVRSYINGVLCELNGTHCRYVATDGAVAGIFRVLNDAPTGSIFINRSVIEACKFTGKAAALALIDTEARTLQYAGAVHSLVDMGKYPDYRRVIPQTVSGEPGTYDPTLQIAFRDTFVALNKAGYEISGFIPSIGTNGTSAALVRIGNAAEKKADYKYSDDFVGVIMPIRLHNEAITSAPAWI